MNSRLLFTILAAAGLTLVTSAAQAESSARAAPGAQAHSLPDDEPLAAATAKAGRSRASDERGYAYTFDDDPLAAQGFSASDAILRVRPRGYRTQLTLPRLSFVPQMLRSVEDL